MGGVSSIQVFLNFLNLFNFAKHMFWVTVAVNATYSCSVAIVSFHIQVLSCASWYSHYLSQLIQLVIKSSLMLQLNVFTASLLHILYMYVIFLI